MDTATSTNLSLQGITSTNDDPNRCAICSVVFSSGWYGNVSQLSFCCGKRTCNGCYRARKSVISPDAGVCCCRFCGCPNPKGNVGFLKKSAKRGCAWAQDLLADLYRIGIGVSQSSFDAVRWYRKAAAAGHPMAMKELGRMLALGLGCSRDLFEAEFCFKKAMEIEEGITDKCQQLLVGVGCLHSRDRKDLVSSVSILLPLAELNVPLSRYNLGAAYKCDGNYSDALEWLTLAALACDNTGMSVFEAMKCCVALKKFSQLRFWLSLTTKDLRGLLSKLKHPKDGIAFISFARSSLRDLRDTCGGCGAPLHGAMCKKCGGCKTYCYCNRDCQKAHWNRSKDGHREDCKGVMELKEKLKEARTKNRMSEEKDI